MKWDSAASQVLLPLLQVKRQHEKPSQGAFPNQVGYFSFLPSPACWGLRNQSLLVSWLVFHSSEITSANTEQQFHPADRFLPGEGYDITRDT